MSGIIWYISSILFLLAYNIYRYAVKTASMQTVLSYVDGRLVSEQSWFDWKKKKEKLKRLGVLYRYPSLEKPHYYLGLHLVCALSLFLIGALMNGFVAVAGFILGLLIPTQIFRRQNRRDNENMLSDIVAMNNTFITSVRGGAYVGDAMSVCEEIVYHPRLKKALREFRQNIGTGSMGVETAVIDFEQKFDSLEIGAMCTILKQGIETGNLVDGMNDLAKHCETNKRTLADKQKARVDNAMSIVMIVLVADVLGFVVWRLLSGMLSMI